ncbi:MAG: lipopolysaccharide kinase InaA family protein [Planctomycetota bacterium]|nr:lipopolysaccharide kinase InaA family protein [Planctomycetota bacterium]
MTFLWRPRGGEVVVVKRSRGRGGRREYENLRRLGAAGLAVPQARAAYSGSGRSLVVMERVPHAETLAEGLARADAGEQSRLMGELLDLVVALHDLGWSHRDLYLEHFLLREGDGRLVLIDLGRARRRWRRRWFEKDLAALFHSVPECVPQTLCLRFLAAYLDARGVRGRRRRRRWLAAVVTRQRRMAARQPRGGQSFDDGAVEEGP